MGKNLLALIKSYEGRDAIRMFAQFFQRLALASNIVSNMHDTDEALYTSCIVPLIQQHLPHRLYGL